MKKALMYWISYDKTSAAGPVWVDVPETDAEFKEIRHRQARLLDNPISYDALARLKNLGFRWIYSASPNQFDGYASDMECSDMENEETQDGN